jgi:hypothetical protein
MFDMVAGAARNVRKAAGIVGSMPKMENIEQLIAGAAGGVYFGAMQA